MSRGVNKAIIVGNLGRNPESRKTAAGTQVTNIAVATSESWKDSNGNKQERTEWHRIVFWGRLAEIAAEYLRKGSKVYVEGRLQMRKWQAQDGGDRYSTEIVASEMQMLDSRGSGVSRETGQNNSGGGAPSSAPAEDFDDDIPFARASGVWDSRP